MEKFVHLHVHSWYSMEDATTGPEDLARAAREMGCDALALTDHANLFGAVKFSRACRSHGLKSILGCEINLISRHGSGPQPRIHHLTLLARTQEGYQRLVRLVSAAHLRAEGGEPRLTWDDLEEGVEGLVALSGCLRGEIPSALLEGNREKARSLAEDLARMFGANNFYLELQNHGSREERAVRAGLLELAREAGFQALATQNVHYLGSSDAWAHGVHLRLQRSLRSGDSGPFESGNYFLKSPAEMADLFPENPELLRNAWELAQRCDVNLREDKPASLPGPQGAEAMAELESRARG